MKLPPLDVANWFRIRYSLGRRFGNPGGALSLYGGIIVDTKRLDKIIEINETALTVTAEAGINGTQL